MLYELELLFSWYTTVYQPLQIFKLSAYMFTQIDCAMGFTYKCMHSTYRQWNMIETCIHAMQNIMLYKYIKLLIAL